MPGAVSDKKSPTIYASLAREIIKDFLRRRGKEYPAYKGFYFLPLSKSTQKVTFLGEECRKSSYDNKGNPFVFKLFVLLSILCILVHLLAILFTGISMGSDWLILSVLVSFSLIGVATFFTALYFPAFGLNFSTFKKHFSTDLLVSINRDLSKGIETPEEVFSRYRVEERLAKLLEDEDTSKDKN